MKTSTLSAAIFSTALFLVSCGEHSHDHGEKPSTEVSTETIKASEDKINQLDETINEINTKEADLEAALEELDF